MPAPGASQVRRRRWEDGLTEAAVWVLGAVVLFGCYLRLSLTVPVNSDGASNALQAWDMLHGNLLLHGWWLSDVSFYTTELPQYMLVELARGPAAPPGRRPRCRSWPRGGLAGGRR